MKSVSLVINTYNRRAFLERTLKSLKYLRYPELEIICVNGPSRDGTAELLRDWGGQIKLAVCPEANLSMSRNIGIKAASGDLVCFIDDDAVPEPNWLNYLAAAFSNPKIAAAGGFIRDTTGVGYQARYIICDRFGEAFFFDRRKDININGLCSPKWGAKYYTALTGTNVCFRRDILVQMGGFDEAYIYFLDETDVLIRLIDAGYELVCIEGAEVHHKYAPSHIRNKKQIPRSCYYPMRSRAYFSWRHAPECYDIARIYANLRHQTKMTEEGVKWHLSNKNLNREEYQNLMRDIRRGVKDGLKLAFSLGAPYLKPPSFFSNPPDFKTFYPFLPAEKRYRLCFISQDYPPNPNGGIGVWASELTRGLALRGHEVSVISRSREGFNTVDFEENVWVHRIVQNYFPHRPYAAPADLPQIIYDWSASAYEELKRIMLIRGIDIAFAPIWDVEGIIAHYEGEIPLVLTLHTSYAMALPSKPEWKTPGYLHNHVEPVIRAEKILWEQAPAVVANSKGIVRDLAVCYGTNVEEKRLALVPHGLEDLCPDYNANALQQQHTLSLQGGVVDSETCRILFVGRFEERKGIDILLSCIPGIAEEYPEVIFDLIGSNGITPYWKDFQARYKNEVWFKRVSAPGFVSPGELSAAYKDCDIFAAPSRYESFGLIYLEAMMRGKPCIGSGAGGVPEVVRDGINGFTPLPGDAGALKAALIRLIEDKELRRIMGEKGRELFMEEYTVQRMTTRMEAAIHYFYTETVKNEHDTEIFECIVR